MTPDSRVVIVHADESCLGNQNEGLNPGGAGALIEARTPDGIARRDLFLSSPETTNNQMALAGAIEVLRRLRKTNGRRIIYLSDSQYLVNGMTSWVRGWKARGWKRKGGAILNLDQWKELDRTASTHDVRFVWVRGHAGHVKNEYADHLAVSAAEHQTATEGLVESDLMTWLKTEQGRGKFAGYDPDGDFDTLARRYGRD